jgi:hypothetical protein
MTETIPIKKQIGLPPAWRVHPHAQQETAMSTSLNRRSDLFAVAICDLAMAAATCCIIFLIVICVVAP